MTLREMVHTAKAMSTAVNQPAVLRQRNGLDIDVTIADARYVYGRIHYLIHTAARPQQAVWVDSARVDVYSDRKAAA